MKIIQRAFYFSLILTAAVFTAAFLAHGFPALSLIPFLITLFWALAEHRHWYWATTPAWIGLVLLLLLANSLKIHWVYLLLGILTGLTAWDISRWMRLTGRAQRLEDESAIVRTHLRRLGGVLLFGFLLSLLGINLQVKISFGWAFLLGLIPILALNRVVAYLRRA